MWGFVFGFFFDAAAFLPFSVQCLRCHRFVFIGLLYPVAGCRDHFFAEHNYHTHTHMRERQQKTYQINGGIKLFEIIIALLGERQKNLRLREREKDARTILFLQI